MQPTTVKDCFTALPSIISVQNGNFHLLGSHKQSPSDICFNFQIKGQGAVTWYAAQRLAMATHPPPTAAPHPGEEQTSSSWPSQTQVQGDEV